jgi:hypothetical protein
MRQTIESFLRRLPGNESGVVAIIAAVGMVMLFGFAAISVDVANIYFVQDNLQASANAAALAGGQAFTAGGASTTALSYSGQAGNRNAFTPQTVTANATLKCLSTVANLSNGAIPCQVYGGQASANALQVTETAVVHTFFASVLGIPTVTLTATAMAVPQGSGTPPLNLMILLDTTASMNSADSACIVAGNANPTRLDCALNGVRTMLGNLLPSVDQVGMMVFPGLTNASQVGLESDCSSGSAPSIAKYSQTPAPVYQIISGSTDYRTGSGSSYATGLNTSSNLSKVVGGGGSGCAAMHAVGGVGTFYADAVAAGQAALVASHKSGQQNVMVILSDGDASASSSNMLSTKVANQCHQAVTAAQAATAASTYVYTIAYGASASSTGSCSTDTPRISACTTMQTMASDTSKFFSDDAQGCTSTNTMTQLNDIFKRISILLSKPRLIPSNAT